ncbi:PPOX class F420-dependent oxidoreductase [Sporichthya brevicatena]|uniref:PPOX class F420-dependent oxidoreductase n=1 Tax=Sporichthya brevicatena TaxID=171442 RepID=A0ABN1G488_9ACTN
MAISQPQLDFLTAHRMGVLVTLKRDGRPQLSNIIYRYDAEVGRVQISVTADRAKTRNAERDPRVSLHVASKDFWSWVVVEGEAALSPVATAPDDPTVEALVALYRGLSGEHPNWDEYRAAMVSERRQVLSFAITHAYGQLPG